MPLSNLSYIITSCTYSNLFFDVFVCKGKSNGSYRNNYVNFVIEVIHIRSYKLNIITKLDNNGIIKHVD